MATKYSLAPPTKPLQTVPATSKGKKRDVFGMVSNDTNYFYYCTGNYGGITNIWCRVSSTGASF